MKTVDKKIPRNTSRRAADVHAERQHPMNTKLLRLLGLVGLGLLVGACGAKEDPAPFQTGSVDLSQVLAEKTGATILTLRDHQGNPYGYVATDTGRAIAPAAASETDMRGFLGELGDDIALGTSASRAPSLGDMRGAAGGSALKIRKVIPGTNVPLLDESVSVGLRDDGSFAFLATGASKVRSLDVAPVLDAEAAKQKALALAGQDATIPGAPELGVTTVTESPVLVYRINIADAEGSLRVDVDAKTGDIVAQGRTDLHALAYSAESYFDVRNDRASPQSTIECSVKDGKLVRETRGGRVEIFDRSTGAPITATAFGDVWVADTAVPKGALPTFTPGIAVNAQFHTGNAADFFGTALVGGFGAANGRITVFVHDRENTAFGAFAPAWNAILVGDGAFAKGASTAPYTQYPSPIAYDMMAHEYAHGLLHNRGLPAPLSRYDFRDTDGYIEAKAIHEGLADIFAMAAESAGGQKPWSSEILSFGGQALPRSSAPYRNHLHPGNADPNQFTTQHASIREQTTPPTGWSDSGWTNRRGYLRSGLVSHTFALMAYGGANETSFIGVDTPLGMSPAFYAFAIGSMFLGKGATILDLAHATVGALAIPSHRTNAACAWVAVGVLPASVAQARYGATCHDFGGTICAGMRDGTYCNAKTSTASYVCRNGQIASGNTCVTGLHCQRESGSFGSRALLDGTGKAACGDRKSVV